jgi:hypothetical protein
LPVAFHETSQDLADGERVPDRQGLEPDERQVPFVLGCSLERRGITRDRIRAIEDHGVDAGFTRGARGEQRRPHVRVVARAHVREIDHQEIDLREVLGAR